MAKRFVLLSIGRLVNDDVNFFAVRGRCGFLFLGVGLLCFETLLHTCLKLVVVVDSGNFDISLLTFVFIKLIYIGDHHVD